MAHSNSSDSELAVYILRCSTDSCRLESLRPYVADLRSSRLLGDPEIQYKTKYYLFSLYRLHHDLTRYIVIFKFNIK